MSENARFGLVVIENRLVASWLGTNGGGGDFDSSYTQAGPGPGHPLRVTEADEWRPFATGAQSRDVTLRAIEAGFHDRGDGASVAVRLESETGAAQWRGWDEPVLITDISTPDSTAYPASATSWAQFALVRIPGIEELAMTLAESGGGSDNPSRTWFYNPGTETWRATSLDWSTAADGLGAPMACAWDYESERLVWLSGPGSGTTGRYYAHRASNVPAASVGRLVTSRWATPAILAATGAPASTDRLSVASRRGASWAGIWNHGSGHVQMASSDRGASWSLVTTIASSIVSPRVIEVSSGFLISYVNASAVPCVRVIGSAETTFGSATEIEINGDETAADLWVARDDDGMIYAIWQDAANADPYYLSIWHMARSLDEGVTWEEYDNRVSIGALDLDAPSLRVEGFTACAGQLHVLLNDPGEGVTLMQLGGWSTVEHATETDGQTQRLERFGWGGTTPSDRDANALYVFGHNNDVPDQQGWTQTGPNSVTEASSDGGYQFTASAAGPDYYGSATGTTTRARVAFWVKMELVSGGTTVSSTPTVGFRVSCTDAPSASEGSQIGFYVGTDGLIAYDVYGATTLATAAFTGTGQVIHVRGHMEGGANGLIYGSAWYRFPGDERWTLLFSNELLGLDAGELNSDLEFGVLGSSQTAVIRFSAVGVCYGAWTQGEQPATGTYRASQGATRGLEWGKAIVPDNDYPCPVLTTPTEQAEVGYLRGRGYARSSDVVDLPVRYDYGVGQLFAGDAPSPRSLWRATGTSEALFAWDWGNHPDGGGGRWLGEVTALVVLGRAAPRQWQIQRYDTGSSAWVTIGTLDLALGTGLSFTKASSLTVTVRPASGATIDRYIHEGELVGGYFTDGTASARIVRNSGGYWSTAAGVQSVRIELDSDGTSIATSGSSGQLIAPGGVAMFATDGLDPRYLRVRVAGSQLAPDNVYQAGVVGIGRVVGVGADPGWGWRRQVELTRELVRRTDQLLEVRPSAPARTVLTYEWPDGVCLRKLNSLAAGAVQDVVFGGGEQVGTVEDAHSVVTGFIRGQLEQGRVPVVVVPRVPALGTTLTDPYRFLYGRILSDSHGIQGILGTEGVDEIVRVDGISVEELT